MPGADTAEGIAKDLIEFCKLQRVHFTSRQAHHESEAIGDDREVRLPHAGSTGTQHERSRHEQFEPNLDSKGRQGPYGKGEGGQERQKGSEGKGKSSGKGKRRNLL